MRNLACWTIGQLLAAYIVVVGLLSAVVVPTAHYLLLSKEQTSVVIATHEELYWTFAQLQLSLERISEEAGKFALNRSTPELLRTRWDVLNSKYNMMSTDSVVTQSLEAVLPGYRDALTDVGNFVADAQKEIENPDARTMRQLMDGVQDLRPMVIEMAIQARASELKARAAQSADINRNHIVVFTAISGMWLFFAVAGFGVLTSRRGMALQLSQKQSMRKRKR